MKRKTRVHREKLVRLSYRDASSDSDINEDDVLEWSEEEKIKVEELNENINSSDTIERVLQHRNGVPGAVGPLTTWYNIQDKGDPNEDINGNYFGMQYSSP